MDFVSNWSAVFSNRTIMRQAVLSVLSLAMLVSSFAGAETTSAQSADPCAQTVVVASGDSLSAIAGRTLGSFLAYPQIVAATNARAEVDNSVNFGTAMVRSLVFFDEHVKNAD